jgi:methylated-DNA-[protein]-cysteine S-methyltransferase
MKRSGNFEFQIVGSASSVLQSAIERWCEEYLSGDPPTTELPLYLTHLDSFTSQILVALRQVPHGVTLTYSELAALADRPRAARPAGMACKRNPFPLVIPCHRVVNTREIGKYAYGVPMKKRLLMHEGALRLV